MGVQMIDRKKPILQAESPVNEAGRTRTFDLGQVAQCEAEFFRTVCGYAYHILIWDEVKRTFTHAGSFYPA